MAGVGEAGERAAIQQVVARPAVEALGKAVLRGLLRGGAVLVNLEIFRTGSASLWRCVRLRELGWSKFKIFAAPGQQLDPTVDCGHRQMTSDWK